jgi:hypothetical protein
MGTSVSPWDKAMSDGGVYIPMSGFTESLNVSVASTVIIAHAVADRVRRRGHHGMARVTTHPISIWRMTVSVLSSPTSLAHIPYR